MTYMPNTIFSCQTTLKKATFLELGLKNTNLATLVPLGTCYESLEAKECSTESVDSWRRETFG